MQMKYHFISNRMFFFKLPTSVKNKSFNTKTGEHNGTAAICDACNIFFTTNEIDDKYV
jgi:hypothetical protein